MFCVLRCKISFCVVDHCPDLFRTIPFPVLTFRRRFAQKKKRKPNTNIKTQKNGISRILLQKNYHFCFTSFSDPFLIQILLKITDINK